MSTLLPIVQYWHATEPPGYIAELTQSFAERNPSRPHILFDASTAEEFIAENFTTRESAAFGACGPPAMQADYLRYCALLHLGGVWADAGFVCLRDITPLLSRSEGGELFRSYLDSLLMNGLLAFAAPGHPFLRLAVDLSTSLIERRWTGKVSAITGPLVITAIYRLHRAGSVDAFLTELGNEVEDLDLLRYARTVCELIGDYEQVTKACQGIRVSSAKCRQSWVRDPHDHLPHRSPGMHWSHKGSNIYSPDRR